MDEIETISDLIDLNFVPDECIADSVSMGDLFPALNQPQIYELESMGNSDGLLAKTLEGKSDKFPYVITESSPCPYRIEAFLLL
ncbi:hypothetical protein I5Q12_19760 [Serratia marcescens]|nr:hypothetical protein [Serratia marcescens]MBH2817552.1 hypothetical protein [Serratia marcescens]